MSINQAVASRQSNIVRQVREGTTQGKLLTVKSYTVAQADALITGAQSVKKARAFLRFLSEKRAEGWRLDPFHQQLKELCHQTLHDHAARRAQAAQRRDEAARTQAMQEFDSKYVVTPYSATTMH